MVSGSRIEGGPQILSAGVRKTIQSIKEIVGNHSDSDIYVTLKETNMDPNETTQKLLNQDHFHEVKRKKDKRKEVTVNKGSIASQPRKHTEHVNQGMRFNTYSDRNIRRGGYSRIALADARVSREFRVVRDNRTNQNTNSEIKAPSAHSPISTNELEIPKISEKSSPTGASNNQKPPVGRHSSQSSNGFTDLHPRQARDAHLSDKKDSLEDMRLSIPNTGSQMQSMKPSDFQPNSTTSSSYSVAGVYSSSSDPVHVPSPDSRPATNIGAIKREVGAVGVRRQSIENSFNLSSAQPNSFSKSHLRHDSPSRESFKSSTDMSKSDQPNQTPVSEPAMPSISVSKPFTNNQFSSRQHQPVGHQKASQTNKEWKPKLTQKQSSIGPGVIGTPTKLTSPPADVPKNLETDAVLLQDKFSRVNIVENQNVIIAAHIRVSETDRSRMIFGSLGTDFESFRNPSFQAIEDAEVSHIEPSTSLSFSAPESYSDESSGKKQVDLLDECVRNSGTNSPAASMTVSELQLTDRNESSSPQDLDNYADIALVHDKSPSYTQSQQQQDHPQLPSFSAYDPQTMYDIPYFRSAVNETVRGHGLQFPQEALSSHTANSIPASTVAMVQQPPPMTQMYPQVHVSHYANLMPYRQFLSPVYVPPMAVPSYSNNPAYPHPSSGNGYLVMPGGSSHLTASGLKYGIQQYKPVPTGSPTGFGNFTSPTGYTINAPGVGSATGLEDSSRLKYKDGNLYVPNPQAETSEIWMNPRDLPSLQSASFYMTGQTPHAAYLPSHTGHASFNSVSQSSHMQFPGMYHPTQASGIPSPHHLSPAMGGGNVGVGVGAGGPGAQVGAYQQPQLGHMNWTGNF